MLQHTKTFVQFQPCVNSLGNAIFNSSMPEALCTKPAAWFDEFVMKKLEWPAQSPNLNPIKQLLDDL